MRRPLGRLRVAAILAVLALAAGILPAPGPLAAVAPQAASANTPNPTTVTIAGSLQSELGCPGDWDPACAATHLTYDAADDVWQGTWTVPAGSYEYKAALNDALGRELRPPRGAGRRQHPAQPRRQHSPSSSTTTTRPTGSPTTSTS